MQNFNTNQTRQFYVGAAFKSNLHDASLEASALTNLDVVLNKLTTGEMYLVYKNADGEVTRSDTFNPKRITSLKLTEAADLDKPVLEHTITIDTDHYANAAALVGKTVSLLITIHGAHDYDMDNSISFVANFKVPTGTTAASAIYAGLASAVKSALPKPDKNYPLITVGSATTNSLVLTEGLQKYDRGRLSGEPCSFSVAFRVIDSKDEFADNQWGKDTVATSSSVKYPALYSLADLEYFAMGERGDYFRGNNWPNDVRPTFVINPFGKEQYDVVTIEYFWAGNAENIQKSPRTIQVAIFASAASGKKASDLHSAIQTAMNASSTDVASEAHE